jgi:site-specific recombinase XerD
MGWAEENHLMDALQVTPLQGSMLLIVQLVKDGLTSPHSKRAYGDALESFMGWYTTNAHSGLNKAMVQSYKTVLESRGLAPSSINQHLSAIRKLAAEAI